LCSQAATSACLPATSDGSTSTSRNRWAHSDTFAADSLNSSKKWSSVGINRKRMLAELLGQAPMAR
jgi:hypothetical protein